MTISQPYISKITIYPIKSLDGVSVERCPVLAKGGLKGDREFAVVDEDGKFVNGKRTAHIHRLRSIFDLETRVLSLSIQGEEASELFHVDGDRPALERWLSDYFQMPVRLLQNLDTGFPDDTDSPGPTIVSTASLEAIASWYEELGVEEVRLRFRSNIEVSGVPPFWEDHLFASTNVDRIFQIGNVHLIGVNPCQRCVVVTRNSQTGEPLANFQKVFVAKRKEMLPPSVERSRFNHFFRLAINTRLPLSEAGKEIKVGDVVSLGSS